MKFVCKYLSRPSEAFYTGDYDYTFIPETSHEACLYCDCSDCELFGRCDNCVFSSECDMNETCFTNNIPIKEKEDIFEEYEEENDLPF